MPCDFSGLGDYSALDAAGGVQWPYPSGSTKFDTERRLFGDGRFYHADGRARFAFDEPSPLPEPPDSVFPFQLLTGRSSAAAWHTQTRTAKSLVLRKLSPQEPYVEIHPSDAQALGVEPGEWVLVESRRGQATVRALLTATIPRRHLFLPMHDGSTNRLTAAVFDPESRQPAYKACAARVRPAGASPDRPGAPCAQGASAIPHTRDLK
jgi:assimilatory nitrate reductase catalytic subunit